MSNTPKTLEQLHDQVRELRHTLQRQRREFEDFLHARGISEEELIAAYQSSPIEVRRQAMRELVAYGFVVEGGGDGGGDGGGHGALWGARTSVPLASDEVSLVTGRSDQRLRRLSACSRFRDRSPI